MALPTPRILPSHLHAFSPASRPSTSTVRLLGSITGLRGDQAVLESCNNENVTLILNRDSHLSLHNMYEIVGKVINLDGGQGLGIRVLGATEWPKNEDGSGIDLKAYEAVVEATHRWKEIFYEGGSSSGGNAGGGGMDGGY